MGVRAGCRNNCGRNIAIRLSFAYPATRGGRADDDQAAETAARLPAQLHRRARVRADARGDRAPLPARVAGHRAQAPAQPAAEAADQAPPASEPRARGDRARHRQPGGHRAAPRPGGGGRADRGGRDRGDHHAPRGDARPRRDVRAPRARRLDGRRGHPRRRPRGGRVAPGRAERRDGGSARAWRRDRQEAPARARAGAPRAGQRAARADRRARERRRDPRRRHRRPPPLPVTTREPFALYVHVPYCRHVCPYCDFNVQAAREPPENVYIEALVAEAAFHAATGDFSGRAVQTVYIAAATPRSTSPPLTALRTLARPKPPPRSTPAAPPTVSFPFPTMTKPTWPSAPSRCSVVRATTATRSRASPAPATPRATTPPTGPPPTTSASAPAPTPSARPRALAA